LKYLLLIATSLFILSCGGPQGATGPQGEPGVSPIPEPIKFCPSYTGKYPGPFPEYGICLSGNIYAVYWDNKNAWLAQVYPGRYKSTSTSAPCTFTVEPNCVIKEE